MSGDVCCATSTSMGKPPSQSQPYTEPILPAAGSSGIGYITHTLPPDKFHLPRQVQPGYNIAPTRVRAPIFSQHVSYELPFLPPKKRSIILQRVYLAQQICLPQIFLESSAQSGPSDPEYWTPFQVTVPVAPPDPIPMQQLSR